MPDKIYADITQSWSYKDHRADGWTARIVTQYTRTELTYPRDKVDALIEAANEFLFLDSFTNKNARETARKLVETIRHIRAISALQAEK